MIKRIFCFIVVLCLMLCNLTFAAEIERSGTCGENLTWTLDSDGLLTISGTGDMTNFVSISYTPWQPYNEKVKKIVIEDGVTSIGKDAFFGMNNLETVVMADSVTVINMGAFTGNRNIKNITMSENITTIGENAFYCCYGIEEFYFPEKVEIICDYTFFEPKGLTKFVVDENNPYFSSDERGVLFNKDKTVLIQYPLGNKETSYQIPKTVQKFALHAFHEAVNLTDVTFEDGSVITEIGQNAFQGCYNLKSISLPDSVAVIDGSAFNGCRALENINIPSNLQKIGYSVFRDCGFTDIDIPESVTTIGDYAFYHSQISDIEIPDSVAYVGNEAFGACENLKTVTIGASVEEIGDQAFEFTPKLAQISVSAENAEYSSDEHGVLFDKNKTVLIHYPIASTDVSYTIPETVAEIAYGTFADAENLESVILPENLVTIGDFAFARTAIKEVSIPATVKSIGVDAFWGCINLENVYIPEESSLNLIGKRAFCATAITEFNVPKTVTNIGYSAFSGCNNLTSVTIPYDSNLTMIGGNIFGGVTPATLYLPEGSVAEELAKRLGMKYTYTNEIKVFVDGERVGFDQHPVIVNDRTLVPLRAIFEALGATVGWNHDEMTATGEKDGVVVSIRIESDVLVKNGQNTALDSPAILVNNRTMVPVRAISEAFGNDVEWNGETREIIINTK